MSKKRKDWRVRLIRAVEDFIRVVDSEARETILSVGELHTIAVTVVTRIAFLHAAESGGIIFGEGIGTVSTARETGSGVGVWKRLESVFRAVYAGWGGRFFDPERLGRIGGIPDRVVIDLIEALPPNIGIDELGDAYAVLLDYRVERIDGVPTLRHGTRRRRSGSHYTPRCLARGIVARTLEPVLECIKADPRLEETTDRPPRTADQILSLKVCDSAMGAGVFLAESCRQLADELVVAWTASGEIDSIATDHPDPLLYARRLVAQRCLYGVDKDPIAVEFARLSLWLEVGNPNLRFTFMDHALRHGDSLVGLDLDQVRAFHWQPGIQLETCAALLDDALTQALEHRAEIRVLAERDDPNSQREKERLLGCVDLAMARVRLVADVCVGAFFAASKAKAREHERNQRLVQVERYLAGDESVRVTLEEMAEKIRREHAPFHWMLEFPEVFERFNPGFDCMVGNPPFMGGRKISTSHGSGYLDWLKMVHEGSHGNADLCTHFFRRAFTLMCKRGTFGLVATNTIAQGDTRSTGLEWICTHDGRIYHAIQRLEWPGMAAVIVSVVHVMRATSELPACVLDGREVSRITAFLFHGGGHSTPGALRANAGKSFLGSKVYGQGFLFDDHDPKKIASPVSEMHRLIDKDPRNAERIFPYIGGAEINSSPTHAHHRHVINFGEMSENEARAWPDLMAIVETKVKPERMKQKREIRKRYWWRFGETTPALFRAIADLDRVLVCSLYSKDLSFAFISAKSIFSHALAIFSLDTSAAFCALQCRVHEIWARFFGSSLGDCLRYTPSDCFETFPFHASWQSDPALDAAGRAYHAFRAQLMIDNDEGLTTTYNRFHDPDERDPRILELRELHAAMDRAVLAAYGWDDIPTACEFQLDYEIDESSWNSNKKKPYRYRWPEPVHDEVLARLLELNQERAAEEERLGLHLKKKQSRSTGRRP